MSEAPERAVGDEVTTAAPRAQGLHLPDAIPAGLRADLLEADALPEIVVVADPPEDVLEAYGLEEGLAVIAWISGGAAARAQALEAGALEVLHPEMGEAEARVRVQTAVARFRSRLKLERTRELLDRQAGQLERNLRLAARLQRSLLPRELPDLPEARFSAAYLPQEFVSGDSYDVLRLDARTVLFYTLDAMGHGVSAALLTVLLRSLLRPLDAQARPRPPHEVVAELNRRLIDARLEESPTAAICYALLDVKSGALRLANAGHPLPLKLDAAGSRARLGSSGLLLGIDEAAYETAELTLARGERVFLFTDGADPGYDEVFVDQLAAHADLGLEDQVGGALGAVIALDPEGRPEDDVTVVALAYRGPGADAVS